MKKYVRNKGREEKEEEWKTKEEQGVWRKTKKFTKTLGASIYLDL